MPRGHLLLGSIGTPGARPGPPHAITSARDLPGVILCRERPASLHVVRVERDGTEHELAAVERAPNGHCAELAASPDGRLLWMVTRGDDGPRGRVFRDGSPIPLALPPPRVHLSGRWSGEGRRLWALTPDESVLLDVASGERVRAYPQPNRVVFARDGDVHAVTAWEPEGLRVVFDDLQTHRHTLAKVPRDNLNLAFCVGGETLWSVSEGPRTLVWGWDPARDLQHAVAVERPLDGEHRCRFTLHREARPRVINVACDCGNGVLAAWNPASNEFTVHPYGREDGLAPAGRPVPMRFRSRRNFIGDERVALREDGGLRAWDPERRAWRGAFDFPDGDVRCLAASPDGRSVAFGRADGSMRVARREDGAVRCDFAGHEGAVDACLWGRDGASLYTASNDGTVRGWDGSTGAERFRTEMPRALRYGGGCTCVLSAEGDMLTVAAGENVATYDLPRDRWAEPWELPYATLRALRAGARGVQFHVFGDDESDPDAHQLAWAAPPAYALRDTLADGALPELCARGELFPSSARAAILVRKCRASYAEGEDAGAVVDLDTGALLPLRPRPPAFDDVQVRCAAAGARWVAAGYEREERVTLWSARTGELLAPIELPPFEHATALAVCEDAGELLVGTNGGRVLRYRIDDGA